MLPQAQGAALGMTWAELQQSRPDARRDTFDYVESVSKGLSNMYVFGDTSTAVVKSGRQRTLVAVVMDDDFDARDSVQYRQRVREITEYWTTLTGQPPSEAVARIIPMDSVPRIVRKWHVGNVDLRLVYHADHARSRVLSRFVRSIVSVDSAAVQLRPSLIE